MNYKISVKVIRQGKVIDEYSTYPVKMAEAMVAYAKTIKSINPANLLRIAGTFEMSVYCDISNGDIIVFWIEPSD